MKTTNPSVERRSVRAWFSRAFAGIINRQCRDSIAEIRERLEKLEDLVDIVAREVARQAKSGKRVGLLK